MPATQVLSFPVLHRQHRALTMRDFHLTPFLNEGFCSRCSKLCKKVCRKCEDAPTYDGKRQITYYCSVKCQLLDWPAHHGTCRARQARVKLLRVAGALQAIWYIVRRETFDWEIAGMNSWKAVTDEDGTVRDLEVPQLELVAKDRDVMEDADGRREQIVYQRFPDGDGEDWVEEEMNAALAFGSCQFAVRMLHGPLRKMIDGMFVLTSFLDVCNINIIIGLHSKTEEICFQPQRCKVNVTRVWISDETSNEELEEAESAEETETFEQPVQPKIDHQDELNNLDQVEGPDANDGASLRSSYADADETVIHNDVHPGDRNWAAYVHGDDDELEHNETEDFDPAIRAQQFAAQSQCIPQPDGYYSREELSESMGLACNAMEVANSCPGGDEYALDGWIIPDDELIHFNQIEEAHSREQVDEDISKWERDPSEEDGQIGAQVHNGPELQHYGHPGYSGHWLRTSKSLRRVPKKENFCGDNLSPIDTAQEQPESDDHSVFDEPYFESEVQLGDTQLHDLEVSNESVDWTTFQGNTQEPEQQTSKEALEQASFVEDQQQEQPPVAEIRSQAAVEAYHCALKIEMSNGELWVFDPTAAQFGYNHILLPLSEYLVRMKSPPSSVCSHPFGTAKSNIEETVAWKQLRKLGREVTDAGDYGEQDIRRRFQWGAMDNIIEEAISKVLGLQKELEKVKAKAQKDKEIEESAANPPKKKPAFNSGPSINRLSTAIKMPTPKNCASNLIFKKPSKAKEGPEIGYKRLLRAPANEHEILLSATLTHLTSLLSVGRESLYTHSTCTSRDNRVKFWSLFRVFHERFPTPDIEPLRPYGEVKKECKKAIKEIARKEKEGRKRMKKEMKDTRRESKRVMREHERRQKELLKRVDRLMRGWEEEDNDERWHNLPTQPLAPTNIFNADHHDPAMFDAPEVVAFDGEEDDEYGYGAFRGDDDVADAEQMAISGMTEEELNALEDFAGHLEWAERSAVAGRVDFLTPLQPRITMPTA
ncbi:hypothetical protein BLS_000727 [Venturia inaequalis]|uniref:MYND-type domain-containing protein n=1 Tax=Venturia inaequalis TaxID=5025 RepID=A0A8H3UZJ0_VENIN|nr:hypothetical protein BLS_000727 [Venturia inaequalis]